MKEKASQELQKENRLLRSVLFNKRMSYVEGDIVTKVRYQDDIPQFWVGGELGDVFVKVLPLGLSVGLDDVKMGDFVEAFGVVGGQKSGHYRRTIFWAFYIRVEKKEEEEDYIPS